MVDLGKVRIVVAVASVAVLAAFATVFFVAATLQGPWIEATEVEPTGVELNGSYLNVTGSYELKSNMPYDIEDFDVSIVMVSKNGGTTIPLTYQSGLNLPSGGTLVVEPDISIFLPAAYAVISQMADTENPEIILEITASCTYIMGTTTFTMDSVLGLRLTDDGGSLSVSTVDDYRSVEVHLEGLADSLQPGPMSMTISNAADTLNVYLGTEKGIVHLGVSTDGDLIKTMGRMAKEPGATVTMADGSTFELDQQMFKNFATAVALLTVI